jgi:hyperosmotically inducible protein
MKKTSASKNHTLFTLVVGALMLTNIDLRADQTDSRIEASAKKSYVFKTYLKDDSITTESKDGVVTRKGTVTESSHKSIAQDTVEGLPGVKSVDNQLKVQGEIPAEHSDGWLSAKVKSTLLFHRNVSATGTDVYVKNGVVSLRRLGEGGASV